MEHQQSSASPRHSHSEDVGPMSLVINNNGFDMDQGTQDFIMQERLSMQMLTSEAARNSGLIDKQYIEANPPQKN